LPSLAERALSPQVLGFPPADEQKLHRWADIIEEWFGGQGDMAARCETCQKALKEYTIHVQGLMAAVEAGKGDDQSVMAQMLAAVQTGEFEKTAVAPNLFFLMAAVRRPSSCRRMPSRPPSLRYNSRA
jgi:hypothetical protein